MEVRKQLSARESPINEAELAGLPLPEILAVLNESSSTGSLLVTGEAERRVLLVDGEVRAAHSDLEEEKLGSWLVGRGVVSEEQKVLALHKLDEEAAPNLGRVMVGLGIIDDATLSAHLQAMALHILAAATRDGAAARSFVPGLSHLPWDCFPNLVTRQVILTLCRDLTDLEPMLEALQPVEQYVHPSRDLRGILAEFELTPVEAFILSRLDGACRVSDVLTASGAGDAAAVAALYGLKLAGLVTMEKTSRARGLRQVRGRPVVDISSFSQDELAERREIERLARAVPQLDHYAALGVEPTSSRLEIELAHSSCGKQYSSGRAKERHLADREAELRSILERVEAAYEVLSKSELRTRYDEIRSAASAAVDPAADGELHRSARARAELARANVEWADQLLPLGEVHMAMQALSTAAQLDPQAQTLLKLARVQRMNPIWGGRALETLQRAVQLDPRCVEVWLELAEIWQRRGQAERHRKALESALKADPFCEPAAKAYATAFGERELQKLLRGLA